MMDKVVYYTPVSELKSQVTTLVQLASSENAPDPAVYKS